MENKKIKVLMCCLGPETHNRGIITVSNILKEAGMEVVYIGNTTPENALRAGVEEDVQIIGVSSLSGAHLHTGALLLKLAKEKGLDKTMAFMMGGVIPPNDIKPLLFMGFRNLMPSGIKREEIVKNMVDAANSLPA
jgi:methylmalonyl-CoA mutase C-terminal domain/subunit